MASSNSYGNWRVDTLLAGQSSITPGEFTEADFLDLAMAALDQGGVSATLQATIAKLISDEAAKKSARNAIDEAFAYVTHDEQAEAGHG